jgi:hypothetical protein
MGITDTGITRSPSEELGGTRCAFIVLWTDFQIGSALGYDIQCMDPGSPVALRKPNTIDHRQSCQMVLELRVVE